MTGVECRIAALCEQLGDGELAQLLADAGAEVVLQRVLDTVRADKPAKVNVADLDNLEEAAARIGLDGLTTGVRALDGRGISTRLPGMGTSGPHFAWLCPRHACTRVVLDTPDAAPVCAITGRPLERRIQR